MVWKLIWILLLSFYSALNVAGKRSIRQFGSVDASVKEVCAVGSSTGLNYVQMDCRDTHGGFGEIVIRDILYINANSCSEPRKNWRCVTNAEKENLPEAYYKPIIAANGLSHSDAPALRSFSVRCLTISDLLIVRYTCHNSLKRHSMCDKMSITSRVPVEISTPFYPQPFHHSLADSYACECTIRVTKNNLIAVTILDMDFYSGPGGLCGAEVYFNGSFSSKTELWDLVEYSQYPCAYDSTNRTKEIYGASSLTFFYLLFHHEIKQYRRGAWLQIQGESEDGSLADVDVTCNHMANPYTPPSSGSGMEPSWTTPGQTYPWFGTPTPHPFPHSYPSSGSYGTSQPTQWSSQNPFSPTTSEGRDLFSTTNRTDSETNKNKAKSSSTTGVIVGVVIGALVVLTLGAVALFMWLKRRSLGDSPETETKGTINSVKPVPPPRNPGMKASVKSGSHSCHEYFEPLDEEIYCELDEGAMDNAAYEVLDGKTNPAHMYDTSVSNPTEQGIQNGDDRLTTGIQNGYDRLTTGIQNGDDRLTTGIQNGYDRLTTGIQNGDDRLTTGIQNGDDRLTTGIQNGHARLTTGIQNGDDRLTTQTIPLETYLEPQTRTNINHTNNDIQSHPPHGYYVLEVETEQPDVRGRTGEDKPSAPQEGQSAQLVDELLKQYDSVKNKPEYVNAMSVHESPNSDTSSYYNVP